jgi:hypothetical protein
MAADPTDNAYCNIHIPSILLVIGPAVLPLQATAHAAALATSTLRRSK